MHSLRIATDRGAAGVAERRRAGEGHFIADWRPQASHQLSFPGGLNDRQLSKLGCEFRAILWGAIQMSKLMSRLFISAIAFGAMAASTAEAANWQVWRTNSACGSQDSCTIAIAVVPTGKRLEIESVSCLYEAHGTGVTINSATITLRNSAGALILRDILVPTSLGDGYFAANHQTKIVAPAGYRLAAQMIAGPSAFGQLIECKLAGQLLP